MNKLPLDGRNEEQKIVDAIDYLRSKGYVVMEPFLERSSVRTPSQLVRFFYDTMAKYNPDLTMYYVGNRKRDLDIAKKFIESRRASGISRGRAVDECCKLIEFLFKYEGLIRLPFKVTSMSVLGQDKMGWVTERLLNAVNGFENQVTEVEDMIWFENFYREQEKVVSEEQIKIAQKRLNLEGKDGTEKKD